MRILDLFAGIGGFSLAAHWMGWETAAFVEWDKDCQKVLKKNFPNVPIYGDITQFHYEQERDRIGPIDLVCGGFPCQPFSSAGKRNGTADDRYLWPEMLRTIREARPAWVVGENVAGLITMDGGRVFEEIHTSLEDEGYHVEAFVIPACAVGAPHRRDRIWIIAHMEGRRDRVRIERSQGERPAPESGKGAFAEYASDATWERQNERPGRSERSHQDAWKGNWEEPWLQVATRLCRVDDGIPSWVDRHRTRRLKQLGNSIVPQVVYEIFRAIQSATV